MTKPLNLGSSWCVTTNLARNWWIIYVFDHLVWVEIVGKKNLGVQTYKHWEIHRAPSG